MGGTFSSVNEDGTDLMGVMEPIGTTIAQMGELGQIGIVWFSIGVAVWQLLLIAKNLMVAGKTRLTSLSIIITHGLSILGSSPLRDLIGRSLLDVGKTKLVSGNTRSMIEMGYWFIKFIEDFEKQYKKSGLDRSDEIEADTRFYGDGQIWGANARTYLKMMRYVSKFLSTQEKFQKSISPRNIQF